MIWIVMLLFFLFLGPIYSWGMLKVFRYTGNPVVSISLKPFKIRLGTLPWAFLWPNAATMGIVTVGSFVVLVWLSRGDGAIAYQHYIDLALVFVSAYPAMAWTDYKLRQHEQERRQVQENYIRKLEHEVERLKKTNLTTEERLRDTEYLSSLYQDHFHGQQIIENDLPTRELTK